MKYAITEGVTPAGNIIWTVWRVVPPEEAHSKATQFYWDPPAICTSALAAEAALRLLSL